MYEAQKKYKDHFDRRLRRVRKLEPQDKVYLNVHDGLAKPGKLVHEVAGPFRVLQIDKKTQPLSNAAISPSVYHWIASSVLRQTLK